MQNEVLKLPLVLTNLKKLPSQNCENCVVCSCTPRVLTVAAMNALDYAEEKLKDRLATMERDYNQLKQENALLKQENSEQEKKIKQLMATEEQTREKMD